MAVRKIKPVTPGQRHKIAGTFEISQVLRRKNPCFDRIKNQEEGIITAK